MWTLTLLRVSILGNPEQVIVFTLGVYVVALSTTRAELM